MSDIKTAPAEAIPAGGVFIYRPKIRVAMAK